MSKEKTTAKPDRVASPLQNFVMRWIPIDVALPPRNTPVLAYLFNDLGNPRKIRAVLLDAYMLESPECEDDGFGDYDEDNDLYYFPAGWYEFSSFGEYSHCGVSGITHWMPLPPAPGEIQVHDCHKNLNKNRTNCFLCGASV